MSPSSDWEGMEDPTRECNSFEFASSWWFHLPMFLLGVFWAARLGKANFFAAANPALENGGLFNYSKFAAQNHFPKANLPKTFMVHPHDDYDTTLGKINEKAIDYPFVIKPDVGERGKGVMVINTPTELKLYLQEQPKQFYMIQDFVRKSQEFGVFFLKNPVTGEFSIPSLTRKIPLQVIGDGESTLLGLVQNHPRARRYQDLVQLSDPAYVPFPGQMMRLSPMGNHCKGAVFLDYSSYITAEMTAVFKQIFEGVQGINYGRLDVKVDELMDLMDPAKIIILEVNGANAEPIQMYSPEKSYRQALKTVRFYFRTMAKLAQQNLKGRRIHFREKDTWASLMEYWEK